MKTFPLLYQIALNFLRVQASEAPYECVFSSSEETDTTRRANLSREKMEQLQILKFEFRGERLSFTDNLVRIADTEMLVLDVSADTIKNMYSRGEVF
jgi:hypothetical protein